VVLVKMSGEPHLFDDPQPNPADGQSRSVRRVPMFIVINWRVFTTITTRTITCNLILNESTMLCMSRGEETLDQPAS
jgi:hypothetical protein